jgi:hypothetical protein
MPASTLSRIVILPLLALAACATTETADTSSQSPDSGGWLTVAGKEPTQAEFAALAATCQDKGGAVESCLTDLGLKRAP